MRSTKKILRSGTAALVVASLVACVSPALAADAATGLIADDVGLVKDIEPGPGDSFPSELTVFGDRMLFAASTAISGYELWITDGTPAGTMLVKDINPGPEDSWPAGFTVFGDRVFFGADDGVHGFALWATDGTAAGTTLVKDISPKMPDIQGVARFTVLGDRMLFTAGSGAGTDDYELWATDGTTAGTVLVKDINPGPGGGYPSGFAVFGSEMLFSAHDGVNGDELWATDGTASGTRLVKDVRPGPESSYPSGFTVFDDRVLFQALDGESPDLWITDGTAAGTRLVKDFPPGPRDGNPGRFIVFGDRALFPASDGVSGRDLWVTDGTTAGTRLVKDVTPGPGEAQLFGIVVFGDRVLFSASYGLNGRALWTTDGTTAGTTLFKVFDPVSWLGGWMTVFGDRVLFSATDSHGTGGLWVIDGTTTGTELLKVINPTGDAFASGFSVLGDQILFFADDGVHGTELWSIAGLGGRIDDQVTRLYQAAFGRAPDPAGFGYWADRYRDGSSLLQIARSFIVSAEFVAHSGTEPTNAQIVDALYQNVLGRAGDVNGRAYFIGLLDTGTSPAEVLIAFSESPDNAARTSTTPAFSSSQSKVLRLYSAAFGRTPDVAGFAFWTDVLDDRGSLTVIAAQFRASPEFTQRYGPDLTNETYVQLLYNNVLGRAPDPAGQAFWLAQLDTTLTRDQVLVAFSESPENIERTNTTP